MRGGRCVWREEREREEEGGRYRRWHNRNMPAVKWMVSNSTRPRDSARFNRQLVNQSLRLHFQPKLTPAVLQRKRADSALKHKVKCTDC